METGVQAFWQQFAGLADCVRPDWLAACRQIQMVTLPAGHTVFRAGDLCSQYVIVRHGEICVRRFAENGREIVLYRVGDGQTCALTTSCLLAHEAYPAEGVTETEVQALLLPEATFQLALSLSAEFRSFVFRAFGSRLSELISLVEAVALRPIELRLAERLLMLAGCSGPPGSALGPGNHEIHKTHQELAAELGSAREVISRQLKEFERRGWLQPGRGSLRLLAPDQMRQLLSQAV